MRSGSDGTVSETLTSSVRDEDRVEDGGSKERWGERIGSIVKDGRSLVAAVVLQTLREWIRSFNDLVDTEQASEVFNASLEPGTLDLGACEEWAEKHVQDVVALAGQSPRKRQRNSAGSRPSISVLPPMATHSRLRFGCSPPPDVRSVPLWITAVQVSS